MPLSEQTKKKISQSKIGVSFSEAHKQKIGDARRGEKHWNWLGGISRVYKTGYYSKAYKDWRKSIFERDNYTCQECGTREYITAHHIKSFAYFPELRFELTNGTTLCETCHAQTDNYKGRAKAIAKVSH